LYSPKQFDIMRMEYFPGNIPDLSRKPALKMVHSFLGIMQHN
jgi:hypothetical protein